MMIAQITENPLAGSLPGDRGSAERAIFYAIAIVLSILVTLAIAAALPETRRAPR